MDKILLNRMQFYGYHGFFAEEKKLGQRFFVDVVLEADLRKAGLSDNLKESIDYGHAYQLIKQVTEGEPYQLIESVAEKVAAVLLENFSALQACTVKVTKPDPPIPGYYDSVAVEIYRERE